MPINAPWANAEKALGKLPASRTTDHSMGLSITGAANALGVNRQTLNNLVNEHNGVSRGNDFTTQYHTPAQAAR